MMRNKAPVLGRFGCVPSLEPVLNQCLNIVGRYTVLLGRTERS